MNLSPDWVPFLASHGIQSVHWSTVGDIRAADSELMRYAEDHDFIVFTHDLDFGTLLAVTNAARPSVIQIRTRKPLVQDVGSLVINALRQFRAELEAGALIVVNEERQRARILPIRPNYP